MPSRRRYLRHLRAPVSCARITIDLADKRGSAAQTALTTPTAVTAAGDASCKRPRLATLGVAHRIALQGRESRPVRVLEAACFSPVENFGTQQLVICEDR